MCTTHDRMIEICDHIRNNQRRYSEFVFYPGMPYAHKYWNTVTELGILEAIKRFVPGNIASTFLRSSRAVATRDMIDLMKILIDSYSFLQN